MTDTFRQAAGYPTAAQTGRQWILRAAMSYGLALWAAAAAGCGNYSNEDLEFMNAIPARAELAVDVPRQSSLTSADSAEGWQRAFQVTRDLNNVGDAFLSFFDQIRTNYPTERDGNTRIWGPFPADEHPGWRIEFRMSKANPAAPQFDYDLVMIPPPGVALSSGGPATRIIGGTTYAAGGVGMGAGHLVVTLQEARTAGLILEGLEKLISLTIDYEARTWPRTVKMVFVNVPPVPPDSDAVTATYAYAGSENGDGSMHFSWLSNSADGLVGSATFSIDSRWLGTGQGREDLSVVAGAGTGATGLECWDKNFASTYKYQSWAPAPAQPSGDSATCISRL